MSGKQVQAGQARRFVLPVAATLVAAVVASVMAGTTQAGPTPKIQGPVFRGAKAFDVSKPLRELAKNATRPSKGLPTQRGPDPIVTVSGTNELALGPAAVPSVGGGSVSTLATTALAPLRTFEGLSNVDNFNLFGFRVNPPDPVGDVGPNHYVEMINLVFGVYDKSGNLLLGPVDTGTLWDGFPVEDCTDPSGDPIVLYDQFADRWILSQFTTRGLDDPTLPFYNCVAISQTGDPTGSYYRYAFTTGTFFPDYPKYGIWKDSYVITTREFGPTVEYGIGVYAIDRNKMIEGDPSARVVSFFVDGNDPELLPLVGDGLLPADVDGKTKPKQDAQDPDRRHAGRRLPLRCHLRRPQHLGARRPLERQCGGERELRARDPAPRGRVRLELPVWPDPRLPGAARDHEPRPVARHPLVPPTTDLAACVPGVQGLRDDGDEPVRRGGARSRPACAGTRSDA